MYGNLLFVAFLFGILSGEMANCKGGSRRRPQEYSARIMSRPSEVPIAKCGEDIRLTCVAEGEPVPEIEWWYHNQKPDQSDRIIIRDLSRDGRIQIKTEELYIIRSTLVIRDAENIDEGIYQCRASNSRSRHNKNSNLYQHWKIEEVPLHKVLCRDSALTQTEVIPAAKYNQSVYDDVVKRATATFGMNVESEESNTFSIDSITESPTTSLHGTQESTEAISEQTEIPKTKSTLPRTSTTRDFHSTTIKESHAKNVNLDTQAVETRSSDSGEYLQQTTNREKDRTLKNRGGCENSGISCRNMTFISILLSPILSIALISTWR